MITQDSTPLVLRRCENGKHCLPYLVNSATIKSTRPVLRALLLSFGAISLICIDSPAQSISNLELRLQADPVKSTAPRTFSVLLVNKTDHDVYVPRPSVDCEDGYDGWFEVFLDFTPLRGKPKTPGGKKGCANDRGGPWPSILDRVKGSVREDGWEILHSGEEMVMNPDPSSPENIRPAICQIIPAGGFPFSGMVAFKDDDRTGTYMFWAKYVPPSILQSDRNILMGSKLDIPRSELWSNHIIILKKK